MTGPATYAQLAELHAALYRALARELKRADKRPSAELLQAAAMFLRFNRVGLPDELRSRAVALHSLVLQHLERALAEPSCSAAILEQARIAAKEAERMPQRIELPTDAGPLALPFDSTKEH